MSHDFCRDHLGEFLDQTLDENQRAQVASHLEGCAACAQIARETAQIRATLRQIAPVAAPATLRQNVRQALQNEMGAERQSARREQPSLLARRPRFVWRWPQLAWSGTLAVAAMALIVLARPFSNAPLTLPSPEASAPVASSPVLSAPPAPDSQAAPPKVSTPNAPRTSAPASKTKPTSQAESRAKNGALDQIQSQQRENSRNSAPITSPQSEAQAAKARAIMPEGAASQQRPGPQILAKPREDNGLQPGRELRDGAIMRPQSAPRAMDGAAPPAPRNLAQSPTPNFASNAARPSTARSNAARSDTGKLARQNTANGLTAEGLKPAPNLPLTESAPPRASAASPLFRARRATSPKGATAPNAAAATDSNSNRRAPSEVVPADKEATTRAQQPRLELKQAPFPPAPATPGTESAAPFSFELKAAPAPLFAPDSSVQKSAGASRFALPRAASARGAPQKRAGLAEPASPGAPEMDTPRRSGGRAGNPAPNNTPSNRALAGRGNREDSLFAAPQVAAPPSDEMAGQATISGGFAASGAIRRFSLQIRAPGPLKNLRVRLRVPPSLRLLWPASSLIWSGDFSLASPLTVPFSLGGARGGEKISVIVEQKNAGAPSRILETQTLVVPAL